MYTCGITAFLNHKRHCYFLNLVFRIQSYMMFHKRAIQWQNKFGKWHVLYPYLENSNSNSHNKGCKKFYGKNQYNFV